MTPETTRWLTRALIAAGMLWAAPAAAQEAARDPVEHGRGLFRSYCASCHGVTGEGHGPLASALKRPPSDLTAIAAGNGGVFPSIRVYRIIDGREVVSHGDPDMPVWGDAFKTTRDGFSEASVKTRIEAIVRYLESIQRRRAQ